MNPAQPTTPASPLHFAWWATRTATYGGLLYGLLSAGVFVATRDHVREFQAGTPSPFLERAVAVAQRGAVEAWGFGALTASIVAVGIAIGSIRNVLRRDKPAVAAPYYEAAAGSLLAAAAFTAWATFGTWLAGELLPFLSARELWILNAMGLGALLAGFTVAERLAAAFPFAAKRSPVSLTASTLASLGAAALVAISSMQGSGGAWKSPARLALVALLFVAALPLAAFLSRFVATSVSPWVDAFVRGRAYPRSVHLTLGALLLAASAGAAASLTFGAAPARVAYETLTSGKTPAGPNVVLVTIDTLRADRLGCYGYDRPTSPFLDSIAAEGTRFEDPVAPAAWTKPSTGTILTGLYPSRHGALYHGSELHTPQGCTTLAEAFREAGYVTGGFVSNPNVKKIFKFDRGFQEFFDSPVEDTVPMSTMRNSAFGQLLTNLTRHQFNWKYENDIREINSHALPWLDANHKRPFFLYLHYIDPHEPYSPPAAYESAFARDHGFPIHNERKRLVASDLYDGEIRYTDDNLKDVVDLLKRHGAWERTLFVVTSDHGEEFFEHGVLGHGFSLYQEVVRVPLLFHGPGVARGRVVKHPVAIVDLCATILDLAGIGNGTFNDGKSFRDAMASPEWSRDGDFFLENEFGEDDTDLRSFVLTAIREGPWKLILNERNAYRPPENPRFARYELYDLGADPRESRNLFTEAKSIPELYERVNDLLDRLTGHATFLQETGFRDVPPAVLTPEVEAGLRAVGYLGGKKGK